MALRTKIINVSTAVKKEMKILTKSNQIQIYKNLNLPARARVINRNCGRDSNLHSIGNSHRLLSSDSTSTSTSNPSLYFTPSHSNSSLSSPRGPNSNFFRVSDHEYQLRLGRAVHLLRATLPDFPRLGLVDYSHNSNSNNSTLDFLGFPSLALSSLLRHQSQSSSASTNQDSEEDLSIYHPSIKFSYRPPLNNPPELELGDQGPNLTFSGRSIYLTSSQVLRHALNVIFTEVQVELERVQLVRSSSGFSKTSLKAEGGGVAGRNDELMVRLKLKALTRVTHSQHEYTVIFRYQFCGDTGLIKRHRVEKIQPAPGRKVSFPWWRLEIDCGAPRPLSFLLKIGLSLGRRNQCQTFWGIRKGRKIEGKETRHVQKHHYSLSANSTPPFFSPLLSSGLTSQPPSLD